MFAEIIKLEQSSSRKLEWKQRRSFIVVEGKPKSVDQLDNCYENMKKLRTLIINNCEGIITVNSFPQMLQNMKLLRVLWLERLPDAIKGLPNEVGDLIHLRYLSLSGNRYMRDLPDSLGRLHNLQTLDLRNTGVNSLPKSMSELKQLRHLFGNCNLVPDIVFTLSQLQTLSDILITTTQARELVNLTQLTLLEIGFDGAESWREICNSVKEMAHLRSLRISSTMYSRLKFENFSPPPSLEKLKFQNLGKLVKFTSTANYLRSLITQWCNIGEDFFNNLEKLPSLEYLHINFYNGQQLLCSGGSFPKLKKLTIMCSKVSKWEIGEGAMKCLESLSIHDCNCLEMLPEGLRELEYLKELHLFLPSQQLVQGISVEGSDRWKIERILRVSIIQKPFLLS